MFLFGMVVGAMIGASCGYLAACLLLMAGGEETAYGATYDKNTTRQIGDDDAA